MKNKCLCAAFMMLLFLVFAKPCLAQDKVYLTNGKTIEGKVNEVGPRQIKMIKKMPVDGPLYVINVSDIDSIVYSNGNKDELRGAIRKREIKENIPQLNTWTFDLLGFTFATVSQSYERRVLDSKIGIRIPLYIGFEGGGIAGIGLFRPGQGVYNNGGYGGFKIATGVNPKFYFFKRRIVRAFAGPEVTLGYTRINTTY